MEDACYVGVLTLLLAIFGIGAVWRTSSAVRFFSAAAILALLLALGTPLNALLFFGLPGWAQTGSPGRILVLWSLCASVLAAIGTDALLQRLALRALGKAAAVFGLLAAGALAYTVIWINRTAPAGTLAANLASESDLWRLPAGILLGAAAAVWLCRRGTFSPSRLGGALVLLTATDLLAAGYGFNRTAAPAAVYPVTPLVAFLEAHQAEGRIMPLNRQWSFYSPPPAILPPNSATVYGLNDTQGYDSLLTGQYFQFAGAMDGGSPAPPENGNLIFTNGFMSPEAQQAGARYAVSRTPLPGLTPVFQDSEGFVYEDRAALPRVRTGGNSALAAAVGPPTRLIIPLPGHLTASGIVVADQWYPGWHADVGGASVPLAKGPGIFRTATLPEPQNGGRLTLRYEPEAFRVGLYALCLALGAAAGIAAGSIELRRRRRGR